MPRFVSVRVPKANLRTSPAKFYPIRLVLLRKSMPVKVIDEFKLWRKIELHDGVVGWLHQSLITGHRTFLIVDAIAEVFAGPEPEAHIIATMEPGTLASLRECRGQWCAISKGGHDGWIPRGAGWGALPGEDFKR